MTGTSRRKGSFSSQSATRRNRWRRCGSRRWKQGPWLRRSVKVPPEGESVHPSASMSLRSLSCLAAPPMSGSRGCRSTGRSVLSSAPAEINPPRNRGRHGNAPENGRSGKGHPCLGHRVEIFPFRSSLAALSRILSRIFLYPLRLVAEGRTFWSSSKRNPFLSVGNFAQTLSGTRSSNA